MTEGIGRCYHYAKIDILMGKHNFEDGEFYLMLAANYLPTATERTYEDIQPFEASGKGYKAGGLPVPDILVDAGENGEGLVFAKHVLFRKIDVGRPSHAVIYNKNNGLLISHYPLTTVTNGGDYRIKIPEILFEWRDA